MTGKKSNPLLEQQKRIKEQENLTAMAKPEGNKIQRKTRKVCMNITLPQEYKERLQEYSSQRQLSASVLIQMWIDEHCV